MKLSLLTPISVIASIAAARSSGRSRSRSPPRLSAGADARQRTTPAPAARQTLTVPFTQFTLPNGLHVILHEDHTVPLVDGERLVPRRLGARETRAAPASRTCSST